jgi:23S rRNA (guanine745-N1)-methyltransferase
VLSDVLEYLICPNCGAELSLSDGAVHCAENHSFDVARQGYLNLTPGTMRAAVGDTAAMVEARIRFLRRGHYSPLARSLSEAAARSARATTAGCVVDVGAGPGYYLAEVLASLPRRFGLALDASKYAMRRAARSHERVGAVVCDAWRNLPVRTGAAAVALNIFAPRNAAELHRLLSPEGRLIVLTPSEDHLGPLVSTLDLLTVDEHKDERVAEKLGAHFMVDGRTHLEFSMALRHDEVEALVAMGPSAWHTDEEVIRDRITALPEPSEVPVSVTLSVYKPC